MIEDEIYSYSMFLLSTDQHYLKNKYLLVTTNINRGLKAKLPIYGPAEVPRAPAVPSVVFPSWEA
jgi:hypothetical protein